MTVSLAYFYTNGTSYFSDSAHTQPCSAPSTLYSDFADAGKRNINGLKLNWAVLSNGIYDIGFILDSPEPSSWGPLWGGAVIGYLSRSGSVNYISAHDAGRELQPSYWATEATGDPDYIALGTLGTIYDDDGYPIGTGYNNDAVHYWNAAPGTGRVLSTSFDGSRFTAVISPGLWHGYLTNDVLTQTVGFDATGELIQIKYDYHYNGTYTRKGFWINGPSFYSPYTVLDRVAGYKGGEPWTDGALTTDLIPQDTAYLVRDMGYTEHWAAWLNSSNYGVGVMSVPGQGLHHIGFEVAYQDGDVCGDPSLGAASGMTDVNRVAVNPDYNAAALSVSQLVPGATYSFDTFVTVGAVGDVRSRFYEVNSSLPQPGIANGSESVAEMGQAAAVGSAIVAATGLAATAQAGQSTARSDATCLTAGTEAAAQTGQAVATGSAIVTTTGTQAVSETGTAAARGDGTAMALLSVEINCEYGTATASTSQPALTPAFYLRDAQGRMFGLRDNQGRVFALKQI